MAENLPELGVIQAVMERLERQTLPRALDIKKNVDAGETLSELDTVFLDEALSNLRRNGSFVEANPEWESLYSRMIDLYDQITKKALENEQKAARR